MGNGNVSTKGHLEWRDAKPFGTLQLNGQNLRVVDVPEAQIDASPDLEFRVDGRRIEVEGAVKVPSAKIVPKDLTNAVRASSDERKSSVRAAGKPNASRPMPTSRRATTCAGGIATEPDFSGVTSTRNRSRVYSNPPRSTVSCV